MDKTPRDESIKPVCKVLEYEVSKAFLDAAREEDRRHRSSDIYILSKQWEHARFYEVEIDGKISFFAAIPSREGYHLPPTVLRYTFEYPKINGGNTLASEYSFRVLSCSYGNVNSSFGVHPGPGILNHNRLAEYGCKPDWLIPADDEAALYASQEVLQDMISHLGFLSTINLLKEVDIGNATANERMLRELLLDTVMNHQADTSEIPWSSPEERRGFIQPGNISYIAYNHKALLENDPNVKRDYSLVLRALESFKPKAEDTAKRDYSLVLMAAEDTARGYKLFHISGLDYARVYYQLRENGPSIHYIVLIHDADPTMYYERIFVGDYVSGMLTV